jgi:hypothetical protein
MTAAESEPVGTEHGRPGDRDRGGVAPERYESRDAVESQLSGFENYPGYELVRKGLLDLAAGRESVEGMLVVLATDRLRRHGIAVPAAWNSGVKERLWRLLEAELGDGAHARYNALIGRVLSFANTADSLRKGSGARESGEGNRPGRR